MTASIENKGKTFFRIIISVIFGFLYRISPFYPFRKIKFMSNEELVDNIKSGKSISRYGDGELRIIEEIPSKFYQKNDKKLANRLIEIAKSTNENPIVCIPKPLKSLKGMTLNAKLFWISNAYWNRRAWKRIIQKDRVYGDTQISRPYIDYKNKKAAKERFDNIKRIWDGKKICIIEGEKTHLGEGNDLFNNVKDVKRIIAPAENAFEEYKTILNEAKRINKEYIFIIALGPTATVLANDLSKCGRTAVDLGHIDIEYEWMLSGAKKKQTILGKYTNEAKNKEHDKTNVLVIGLAGGYGGAETVFKTYYDHFDKNKYSFDFISREKTFAFQNEYESEGSNVFFVSDFTKHPIKYYRQIKKIINNGQYDVVHINLLSAANILPIVASMQSGVERIVLHSHNGGTDSMLRKALHKINRKFLSGKKFIRIACSRQAGEFLFGKSDYIIIYNTIDFEKFKYSKDNRFLIRKNYGIDDDEYLIGAVGRLTPLKNHIFLIDSLSALRNENFKMILIGSGDMKNDIAKKIKECGLDEKVIIVDKTDEVYKYYSAFDLYVMPSAYEGLSMAGLEAQASGLDCLFSDGVSTENDIANCKHLKLDKSLWTESISSLMKKHSNRICMKPDNDILAKFDIKNNVSIFEKIYNGEVIYEK